jgi:hypothetical protein
MSRVTAGLTAGFGSSALGPSRRFDGRPGERIVVASGGKTAWLFRILLGQEIVALAKAASPRCLTTEQRRQFFLPAEPPNWCIEQEKWPYHTPAWKQWLSSDRLTGKRPPLPPAP